MVNRAEARGTAKHIEIQKATAQLGPKCPLVKKAFFLLLFTSVYLHRKINRVFLR